MVDACGVNMRTMPKIELHAHLSGSISRQCLHDIWLQKHSSSRRDGPALQDPLIEMPEDKYDYDLETFFPLFSKYIYALCNDAASIIYSTNSVLQSFHDDGVVYLELRTTPRAIPSAGITKDDYVQLVISCITSFKSSTMITKLILSIDRRNTEQEAQDVVSLALKHRTQGVVVAVDLCGNPATGDVSIFRGAFQRAKDSGLKITLHFAEAPQSSTDLELRTLLSYGPDRIGHVINVPEEIRDDIAARRIGLELCLSCNVHAKMITGGFGEHHFGYWRGRACPLVLCTDDVGVFGSSLSHEYELVREHFGLSDVELVQLARSGIECIFGGEEEKARLREVMWHGEATRDGGEAGIK